MDYKQANDTWKAAGEQIIELLDLPRKCGNPNRYHTARGDKTPAGIAKTLWNILIQEGITTTLTQ